MSAHLDIKLKKVTKTYCEGDDLTGVIVFDCKSESRHEGITLTVEGMVNMQLSSKNVGIFEAFYNSVKPVSLINYSVEIAKSGKLPIGKTEIAFELPLRVKNNKTLFQTYHGVFITIQYMLKCEVKRSMLNKDLQKVIEFIIENKPKDVIAIEPKPVNFVITPESLQNVKDKSKVPLFKVSGRLESTLCKLSDPLSGEICVEHCDAPIRSIELQLVRVETCGCAEGYARDATEIQNIQIGEGDVCRGVPIPIYMVFPRLFTCPTLITCNFKIEFEVNIVVIFEDNHLITENFPIKLIR
ncbi:Down syndrome critical region protein 3-like protein [Dinothrombium tinctorium]|uniref:Vacuolar protein sorting-associated protein 26C n=1 Tax=Dinothrombium tinctorium TaxID=1965070 RepID=A0A3S4QC84_9ACAR|nr:Down syndrome critical region protein 3-like protein [Dinothrombium tinctorium]